MVVTFTSSVNFINENYTVGTEGFQITLYFIISSISLVKYSCFSENMVCIFFILLLWLADEHLIIISITSQINNCPFITFKLILSYQIILLQNKPHWRCLEAFSLIKKKLSSECQTVPQIRIDVIGYLTT